MQSSNTIGKIPCDDQDEIERIAAMGVWRWTPGSETMSWSPNLNRLFGREPTEPEVSLAWSIGRIHPEDRAGASENLKRMAQGGGDTDHEYRIVEPDGSIRNFWISGHAIRDDAGRIVEIRGICQDVTDRVAAAEALRESERQCFYAAELNPQIPWTADPDGMILGTSSRWTELTGISEEDAVGGGWCRAVHPDDLPDTLFAFSESLASGETFDREYRVMTIEGTWRWMRAYAAARKDADGTVLRWYGSLEDIHDRKTFENGMLQNENRYRTLVDASGSVVWHAAEMDEDPSGWSLDGMQGIAGAGWKGLWKEALHPDESERVIASRASSVSSRTEWLSVHRLRRVSGEYRWVRERAIPIGRSDGSVDEWVGLVTDITETHAAQEAIERASARMTDILESTTDNVFGLDRDWNVTFVNRNASQVAGVDFKLKVGTRIWDAFPEMVGGEFHLNYAKVLETGTAMRFEAFFLGGGLWLDVHAYPTSDGLSVFFRDISEERRIREEIRHLAHHDPLTGLANRTLFNEQLAKSISKADAGELAVLLLDLDEFKEVNDTLGHPVGDALLREVSGRFLAATGNAGLLSRLGGDEFGIIHAVAQSGTTSLALASRLVASLAEPIVIDGNIVPIGVSVGIALSNGPAQDADELFGNADVALYASKAGGGHAARTYEPCMHDVIRSRQSLRQDMAGALERGEFEVFYQPQIDVATGTLAGYEALLRWTHPVRGPVSPTEFIVLAEETGRIGEIGEWVLERACADMASLPGMVPVAVNLSPLQLKDAGLPLRIASLLARHGVRRGQLELEITESFLLHDGEANLRLLHEIRSLGVGIALDDFGTGYSSLGYLRNFPFDKIKIDRSFVSDIGAGNHSEAIMKAVIGLGHAMGMTITAEGVETDAQLGWLKDVGCDVVQGYLTGRPAPLAASMDDFLLSA